MVSSLPWLGRGRDVDWCFRVHQIEWESRAHRYNPVSQVKNTWLHTHHHSYSENTDTEGLNLFTLLSEDPWESSAFENSQGDSESLFLKPSLFIYWINIY